MWDVGCVIGSVLFFFVAIAYTHGCEQLATKAGKQMLEIVLLSLVTIGLLVYLVYALLQPEKF